MNWNVKAALMGMGLLVAMLVSLLAAVGASFLAYLDGATLPSALVRGGVAFGGTMGLLTAVVALLAGVQM